MGRIVPFLVILLAAAFFTGADFFFYLLYALSGIYALGRVWARRSVDAVAVERRHDRRVFLGESFRVAVEVRNEGWLPVLWMRLSDTVPAQLTPATPFRRIISLGPKERLQLEYRLVGRRRGYYPMGPFVTQGGDLLGTMTHEASQGAGGAVVVYPKIVPLHDLGLPSQMPFGALSSHKRLFEDPSRIQGVRDYQPGDSPRHMDWKTSARLGALQVRRYEPAIALETAIFLNLSAEEYPQACIHQAPELGIVVAASAAVRLGEMRQAVGLVSNGRDPLAAEPGFMPALPLRKGRHHLTNLLELLARIEIAREGESPVPFRDLLIQKSLALPWGSTVLAITSRETEGLVDALLALRRRGLAVILVLTCPDAGFASIAARVGQIGVETVRIWRERDLDVWR
ncbi:MAG: DUF58 domain-containing protein [Anaerolineae bacterium]|jgi:uncharacterized protein (DUF58 family)